jgi:hypothetical protein
MPCIGVTGSADMIVAGSADRERHASSFPSTGYKGSRIAGIGAPASLTKSHASRGRAGRGCSRASVAACHAAPRSGWAAAIARALPFWQQRGMSR